MAVRPDLALADLARRQLGVFTLQQAEALGLRRSTVLRRAERGELVRLQRGVYVSRALPDSRERRMLAAVLAVGGEAALARASAAEVLRLPVPSPDQIHVVVRNRTLGSLRGVRVHRTSTWRPAHVTRVGPFPVTTVARTVVDLAMDLDADRLKKVVTQAIREQRCTTQDLAAMLNLLGGVRGSRNLRRILDELSPLTAQAASSLESLFLEVTTARGVPPTAMNHPVVDAFGRRRYLDAVYLPEHVPVELDGRRWHGLMTDHHADLRRENAIVLTGEWRPPLRYSWWDLTERPGEVVDEIRCALGRARASSVRVRRGEAT